MLVSIKARLAILAMPKTGTTALEEVLAPHCEIAFLRAPQVKHMTQMRFDRFMRPYLTAIGVSPVESCCLFRDPMAWLESWHRYRARPELTGHPNSTAGVDFAAFVEAYMADPQPAFARVGRQARFVRGLNGGRVTHLFAYEAMPRYLDFLGARLGAAIRPARRNVSNAPREAALPAALAARLRAFLEPEYAIHASLPRD